MTTTRVSILLASLCLFAVSFAVGCSGGDAKPAAREAPKRTRAPEEPEPQPEAIDQHRIQAASMLADENEPEPPPMVEEEMAKPDEHEGHEGHDHDEEPAEGDDAEKPAPTTSTMKATAPPAMKPKSLIR